MFLSDEGRMLETLDYTIRIGSTLTFLYYYIANKPVRSRFRFNEILRFVIKSSSFKHDREYNIYIEAEFLWFEKLIFGRKHQ